MHPRIEEALLILAALGFPQRQRNERSALTLLALLNITPEASWAEARDPLIGITPMMKFFARHYGKEYKPNTRETVRRQTVHQFLHAGLVIINPDAPERPVNSPKAAYQIENGALELLQRYHTEEWEPSLNAYLATVETLQQRYAQERQSARLAVPLAQNPAFTLSPGGQNVLIQKIVTSFVPHFVPGGKVLYVGDADEKFAVYEKEVFAALGVEIEEHGKMPDVIVHDPERNRLILLEAVTSHGPVDPKRREELQHLFRGSVARLVFVTAFLTRKAMNKYLDAISWETDVWVADAPSHLIHFNGDKFLSTHQVEPHS